MVMVFDLTACGSQQTPATDAPAAEGDTLPYEVSTLRLGMAPLVSADVDRAFWDKQCKLFTEQTGAVVEVEVNDWSELEAKYLSCFLGGTYSGLRKSPRCPS